MSENVHVREAESLCEAQGLSGLLPQASELQRVEGDHEVVVLVPFLSATKNAGEPGMIDGENLVVHADLAANAQLLRMENHTTTPVVSGSVGAGRIQPHWSRCISPGHRYR